MVPHCLAPRSHSDFDPQQSVQWHFMFSLYKKNIHVQGKITPGPSRFTSADFKGKIRLSTWCHMRSLRLCHPVSSAALAGHLCPSTPVVCPPASPCGGAILNTYAREIELSSDCLYGKSETPLQFKTSKFSCDRCCHGRQVSKLPSLAVEL